MSEYVLDFAMSEGDIKIGEWINTHQSLCHVVLMNLASGSNTTLSDRMQNLYQEWYVLEDEQKAHVKSYTISKMEADLKPVYNSIIEIFILWDDTQKNGAAPGYDYNDDIHSPYYSDIRDKIRRVLECLESSVKYNTKSNAKKRKRSVSSE